MYSFELDPTEPNQVLNTTLDGNDFYLQFNTAYELLFCTISVNGVVVKTSGRCIPNTWLIPYPAYAPDGCGNFRFITVDDNYPNYKDFNTKCMLVYYSADEVKEAS